MLAESINCESRPPNLILMAFCWWPDNGQERAASIAIVCECPTFIEIYLNQTLDYCPASQE